MQLQSNHGSPERSDRRVDPIILGVNAVGEKVVLLVGTATSDGTIVTEVGADTQFADGSLYLSVVNGSGALFQKRNDTWTSI